MSTNRTWYSELNYLNADTSSASNSAKSLLWGIKAMLCGDVSGTSQGHTGARPVGSRWTVLGSSNGTTGAIDAVDRWGSTFSAANMVRDSAGNARSWIILQSPAGIPGGPYYWGFDYRDTTDQSVVMFWSKGSGYSGTVSSITFPSDAVVSNASPFVFHDATATSWKISMAVDANGSWYIVWGKTGSGVMWGFQSFTDLENASISDTRPVASMSEWNVVGGIAVPQGSGSTSTLRASAHNHNATAFYSATTTNAFVGAIREASGVNAFSVSMVGPSPIDASITGFKVPIIIANSPNYFVKGAAPDMLQVGQPVAQGSADPVSGNIDHIQVGQFRLPFNGALTF